MLLGFKPNYTKKPPLSGVVIKGQQLTDNLLIDGMIFCYGRFVKRKLQR